MPACWPTTTSSAPSRAARVTGSTGRSFLALRPTLSDIVLKMPRGAQVIYPKDLGAILIAADIGPGQRVLEAGVGSGALSMTVLRAGASIVGYELREDFAERATGQRGGDAGARHALPGRDPRRDRGHRRDAASTGSCSTCPSPTRWSPAPPRRCVPGGILLAYLPTINQTALLRQALDDEACPSAWPRRKRSCGAPGTSRPARSAPTTAWSGTPASSPRRGGWTVTTDEVAVHRGHRRTAAALRPAARIVLRAPRGRGGLPTACRPTGSERRLNLGVWSTACRSTAGARQRRRVRGAPPELSSGKGTIRIRPQDAEEITDDELRGLLAGAPERG